MNDKLPFDLTRDRFHQFEKSVSIINTQDKTTKEAAHQGSSLEASFVSEKHHSLDMMDPENSSDSDKEETITVFKNEIEVTENLFDPEYPDESIRPSSPGDNSAIVLNLPDQYHPIVAEEGQAVSLSDTDQGNHDGGREKESDVSTDETEDNKDARGSDKEHYNEDKIDSVTLEAASQSIKLETHTPDKNSRHPPPEKIKVNDPALEQEKDDEREFSPPSQPSSPTTPDIKSQLFSPNNASTPISPQDRRNSDNEGSSVTAAIRGVRDEAEEEREILETPEQSRDIETTSHPQNIVNVEEEDEEDKNRESKKGGDTVSYIRGFGGGQLIWPFF